MSYVLVRILLLVCWLLKVEWKSKSSCSKLAFSMFVRCGRRYLFYISNLSQIGPTVSELQQDTVSLFFIVFSNRLIHLMRKIGEKCSWICNFCQYFAKKSCIKVHSTFILQNFALKLTWSVPNVLGNLSKFSRPPNLHICIIN